MQDNKKINFIYFYLLLVVGCFSLVLFFYSAIIIGLVILAILILAGIFLNYSTPILSGIFKQFFLESKYRLMHTRKGVFRFLLKTKLNLLGFFVIIFNDAYSSYELMNPKKPKRAEQSRNGIKFSSEQYPKPIFKIHQKRRKIAAIISFFSCLAIVCLLIFLPNRLPALAGVYEKSIWRYFFTWDEKKVIGWFASKQVAHDLETKHTRFKNIINNYHLEDNSIGMDKIENLIPTIEQVDSNIEQVDFSLDDGTQTGQMAYWNNEENRWYHTEINDLYWDHNNKRLGVGTANPRSVFSLKGNRGLIIENQGTDYWNLQTFIDGSLRFNQSSGLTRLIMNQGGNIGINNLSPNRKLEITDNTSAQLRLSYDQSNYFDMQSLSDGDVYVNPSGSGIGFWENNPTPSSWLGGNANVLHVSRGSKEAAELVLDGTARFYFRGGVTHARLGSLTNNNFIFDIHRSPVMHLSSSGLIISNASATTSARKLESYDRSNPQLRLSQNPGSVYTDMGTNNSGVLDISPTGSTVRVNYNGSPYYSSTRSGTEFVLDPTTGSARTILGAYDAQGAPWSVFGNNFYITNSDFGRIDSTWSGWGFVFDGRPAEDLFKMTYVGAGGATKTSKFAVTANGSIYAGNNLGANPRPNPANTFYFNGATGRLGVNRMGAPDRRIESVDNANPQLRLTHTPATAFVDLRSDSNGDLYISSNNTVGNTDIYLDGAIIHTSDVAKKKDIRALEYGLKDVMKLNPVNYNWKNGGKAEIGFIAQELKNIIPEVVHGKDGNMGVAYAQLTALAIKAIQEQQIQIEEIKLANKEQTEKITNLTQNTELIKDRQELNEQYYKDLTSEVAFIDERFEDLDKIIEDHEEKIEELEGNPDYQKGSFVIKKGEESIKVDTKIIHKESLIFLSPVGEKPVSWIISDIDEGESFEVLLDQKAQEDIKFNWWILAD
ncbi:MAG: hypothetical protein GF332_04655 [Candidatus Moranbacteria bacterium]|nr:hypothetical protein [Candidatus Moranbacteria bacterium]